MPDWREIRRGRNPFDPSDAMGDKGSDGLSTV